MNTIEDVQRILGRSRRQVRERLDALASADHLLAGQVVTGPHGRKEYAPAVLDMLRDLDMLAAQDALTLRQAAGQLAARIHGSAVGDSVGGGPSDNGNRVHLDGQAAEVLRREVDVLRAENQRLWSQVDRLTDLLGAAQAQLALPAPRRRPWWRFGRRPAPR
jgi:hypothetical protein